MSITQSAPWRLSRELEGGFSHARELLSHYGARLELVRAAAPGEPFLYARFIAWPIEG
jgi:hypothetical protein